MALRKTEDIIKQINKNYRYSEYIKRLIRDEKSQKQKLLLLEYLLGFNSSHIIGRYSDEWIEEEIIKIGKQIRYHPAKEIRQEGVLFVMTTARSSGGHTALVNNWIRFDTSRNYSIAFTEPGERELIPDFLLETVQNSGGDYFFLDERDLIYKAEQLLTYSERFEKIILMVHMYDMVPILAYSHEQFETPVYFYNHANFSFSIGISVSDCSLYINQYDREKAIQYRGAENTAVLPIPQNIIKTKGNAKDNNMDITMDIADFLLQHGIKKDSKIVLSMGSDYKYNAIIGCDFGEFAEKLVEQCPEDVYLLIIGAKPKRWRWKKLYKKTKGHVIALGTLTRDYVSQWMKTADVFVISFPMMSDGGPEALTNKIPVYCLDVIGRGTKNKSKAMVFVSDIDELVNNIMYYFDNSITFKDEDFIFSDTQEVWCSTLNTIWEDEISHTLHSFHSEKVISKEEIVNYQLLKNNRKIDYSSQLKLGYKTLFLGKNITHIDVARSCYRLIQRIIGLK